MSYTQRVVIGDAVLYQGDCMAYMATLPDKAFDLAIVDPPYGINAPTMAATPCQRLTGSRRLNGGGGKLKDRMLNNSECNWDSRIPDNDYFAELFRVSKNQVIWGGNYFALPPSRGYAVWDKVQPWPNFSATEFAWSSFDCPSKLFKFDNRTGDKIHPTQKPIALYEWLLTNYAKPGQRILDTHLGSGSSAIAALGMGFEFVGCELDKDYFASAVKRIENTQRQQTMFAPEPIKQEQAALI